MKSYGELQTISSQIRTFRWLTTEFIEFISRFAAWFSEECQNDGGACD